MERMSSDSSSSDESDGGSADQARSLRPVGRYELLRHFGGKWESDIFFNSSATYVASDWTAPRL